MQLSKRSASAARISCAKEQPSLCLLHADWMMLNNVQLQIPHVEGETGAYSCQRFIDWLAWSEAYGAWRHLCIYYANSVSTFQPLLVGDLVFKINPGLMYNAGLRIRFVWPIYRPSSHKGLNLRVASVFSRSLASYMFSHAGFIGS